MKTKAQKQEAVDQVKKLIADNKGAIFTDVQGITVEQLTGLRRAIREEGGSAVVCKKRLLDVAMKEAKVEFSPSKYGGSVLAVFAPEGVEQISGPVVKFLKEIKLEKTHVLGGYNFAKSDEVEQENVLAIGNLPSREVVLAQLMGMLQAPLRSFMYIIQEKAKQS